MEKNKVKLLITSLVAGVTCVLAITASFAWFGRTGIVYTDEEKGIKGSVLGNYFDGGDGTEGNPFKITRPKHWENLVYLHNNVPDFYNAKGKDDPEVGKGYYFQIGKDLNNDQELEVYNYDDEGNAILTEGKTYNKTTLNLTCFSKKGQELIPLGSPQYPFNGEIQGNNFSLQGFTVVAKDRQSGTSFEDIGIFGYVAPNAYCKGIYFSNYTINTDDSVLDPIADKSYAYHTPHLSENSQFKYVAIGTLAGHIRESACFEDIYINKCTVKCSKSDTKKSDKGDQYGYYGVVEKTKSGSDIDKGHDYSFKLDSSKVYEYMNTNYSNIYANPVRARNTEYDDEYNNGTQFNDDNTYAKHPLENSFHYETSGFNTYNLLGDDPDDYSVEPHIIGNTNSYQGRNYSLSTLGYQAMSSTSVSYKYKVVAADKDGSNVVAPTSNMEKSDKTYSELSASRQTLSKELRAWNSTEQKFEYFKWHTADSEKIDVYFKIKLDTVYETDSARISGTPSLSTDKVKCKLFVDGSNIQTWTYDDFTEFSVSKNSKSSGVFTVKFDKTSQKLNLYPGPHHLAVAIYCQTDKINCSSCIFYYAAKYNHPSGISAENDATLRQILYDIPFETENNHVFTIDLASTDTGFGKDYMATTGDHRSPRVSGINLTYTEEDKWDDNNRYYKKFNDHYNTPKYLFGKNLNDLEDKELHPIDHSSYEFNYFDGKTEIKYPVLKDENGNIVWADDDKTIPYFNDDSGGKTGYIAKEVDVINYDTDNKPVSVTIIKQGEPYWIATYDAPKSVDTTKDPVFIADDDIFKPYTDESGNKVPGYVKENIDVVGGGFRFSSNYMTIDGEDNRGLVHKVTDTDFHGKNTGIGNKFYSTLYAANSIVLYLSNVSGFEEDDRLGTIVFNYEWTVSNLTKYITELLSKFKSMCFKKGGTDYSYFSDVQLKENDYEEKTGSTILEKTGTLTLRRGVVKKAAYCALDKDGNILCGFNTDGSSYGNTSEISENDIKTYVLLVGVKNTNFASVFPIKVNTRIKDITFNYLASKGYGGDFGKVEYRDRAETVTDTIFNFYTLLPTQSQFSIYVSYDVDSDNKKRYTVTFNYYNVTTTSIKVMFYLYNSEYSLVVNGNSVCANSYMEEVTITSSSEIT